MTIGKDKIFEDKNEVHHESAGGYVFYSDPNEGLMVALLKKTDGTYWIPKGHVMEGESPEDAATREIIEELALEETPKMIKSLGVESYSYNMPNDTRKHYKDVHLFIYESNKKSKLSVTKLSDKEIGRFLDPEWLTVDVAKEKLQFDSSSLGKAADLFNTIKNDK